MKVYFCDCRDRLRLIADVSSENEAWNKIHDFCSDHNYKIPYIRSWQEERDGIQMTAYDVGSHTEFFYVEQSK